MVFWKAKGAGVHAVILSCFNCSSLQVCYVMVPFSGLLMQHTAIAGETSRPWAISLCTGLAGARQLLLISQQPVINVKFNCTSFYLLPCKSSPPARERSDCFGVSSSPCCWPHAGVIFLSSILSAAPFALCPWRLLCKGQIKDLPWKINTEQRKGNFGEDCRSYVRSNRFPVETAKKCNFARAIAVCWGKVRGWFWLLQGHLRGYL